MNAMMMRSFRDEMEKIARNWSAMPAHMDPGEWFAMHPDERQKASLEALDANAPAGSRPPVKGPTMADRPRPPVPSSAMPAHTGVLPAAHAQTGVLPAAAAHTPVATHPPSNMVHAPVAGRAEQYAGRAVKAGKAFVGSRGGQLAMAGTAALGAGVALGRHFGKKQQQQR